ncbi:hypothetical protein ScPMuIL_015473 [Solemya velum]
MSDSEGSGFSDSEGEGGPNDKNSDAGSNAGSDVGSNAGSDADSDEAPRGSKRHIVDEAEEEDEIDEEEEEDYDDEEMARKRRKRKHRGFILDEADVDDEGDEDDDEDFEEGYDELIDKKSTIYEGTTARDIENTMRGEQIWMNQTENEIEEYYRTKYGENAMTERYGEGEEMSDEITQQGLLPGVKDPNLWLVKCRIGEEQSTAFHLMRKFIAYQFEDEPLQIKSVIAKESLKGYIYVEAYKQTHVKQAIEGIGSLRIGLYAQQMVPIKEMTDVLKVVKETTVLKPKAWVRLKRGVYKDDLAQVDYVEPAQNIVHLKLIPRIDYTRPRGLMRNTQTDPEKRKKKRKPAQKLFDVDSVRAIGGEVTTDGDFLLFEGNRYSRKGFLFKSFVMSAIVAEGVKPTLTELERFEDTPEGAEVELIPAKSEGGIIHKLSPGDVVEVCEGELIHLQGKVISIDGNKIMMLPKHEDLKDPLEFSAHELKKHFKMGDHVKVIGGRYEGDTGLIVRVEENQAVLFSDLTMHELKVLPKDLQLCADMATGVDSLGQFQFGDLVQLDPQTVGTIVRLEKENFQVLNMHNKVISVKPQSVNRKRDTRNAVALDSENNNIQVRDIVKVIDGPHSGRQGEIKHLYRSFAFLMSRMMTENGGYFVCRTRHLVLAGGSKSVNSGLAMGGYSPMSPSLTSPAHPSQGGQGGGPSSGGAGRGRGGLNRRDRELIGQTIRIIQGPFKGYIGIVKDATESTARVELLPVVKRYPLDRARLSTLTGQKPTGATSAHRRTPMYGGQTPMYGSRTPMYGSQTPVQDGSRTPHYGGQTPLHEPGSRTPGLVPGIHLIPIPFKVSPMILITHMMTHHHRQTLEPLPTPPLPRLSGRHPEPVGPYTPQTPGSAYSPYGQNSPSPSGFQATSPGFMGSPSPVGYQPSASPSGFASTPSPLVGVVRSTTGGMCSVFIPDEDKVVNIACEHLEPVLPEKGDK